MNDPLKKFIDENRPSFDTELPGEKVWVNIHKKIEKRGQRRKFTIIDIYKWSAAAAVACILLTSAYFFWIKKDNTDIHLSKQTLTSDIEKIAPAFASQFRNMANDIQMREVMLKSVTAGEPALYEQFTSDKQLLDSTYLSLKSSLKQTPNEAILIEALLQNMELQVQLLQQQIQIIHQYKKAKKSSHEKNDSRNI